MAVVVGHAKGLLKAGGAAGFGLLTGAVMMYSRAAVEKVTKSQPLANFSVSERDGLKVTFHNQASGDSGYWDFGDGTALEPFVADAPVAHTYPKAGTYTAKLTVRNFLMDEKERTVTVDVEGATAAPGLLPKVELSVKPVGRAVAPATFRVSGTVENVERAFLDLGDRVEVAEVGPFDKYIVIDKPSQFPIQLIGHSGKQAVKQSQAVTVEADRAGGSGFSAVVRTTDAGTRTRRDTWAETVAVPAVKGAKGFEKVVAARPGFMLTEAKVIASGVPKGVKGLAAAVAPDKKSVKVSGEWADAAATEALVPLSLTGERATPVSFPQTAAVPLDSQGVALVPLPPRQRDMNGLTRKVAVEFRYTGPDGKPQVVASAADLKQPWAQPTADGRMIRAELAGEQVKVSIGR